MSRISPKPRPYLARAERLVGSWGRWRLNRYGNASGSTPTPESCTVSSAMPPSAMMPPARMKNGIARSAKSSVPSETFSITASSGMSTHKAARMAPSPRA